MLLPLARQWFLCLLNLLRLHLHVLRLLLFFLFILFVILLVLLPLLLLLMLLHLLSCSVFFCRLPLALLPPPRELLLMLSVFSFQLLLVLALALATPLFVVCRLIIARARETITFACLLVVLQKLTLPPSACPRKLFRIHLLLLAPALIPVALPFVIEVEPALIGLHLACERLLLQTHCLCTFHVFGMFLLGTLDLLCLFT